MYLILKILNIISKIIIRKNYWKILKTEKILKAWKVKKNKQNLKNLVQNLFIK